MQLRPAAPNIGKRKLPEGYDRAGAAGQNRPTRQLLKSIELLPPCDGDDAGTSGPTNRSRKGISELQSTELVDSAEILECLVLSLNCFAICVTRSIGPMGSSSCLSS